MTEMAPAEFLVVMRARSAARFPPERGWLLNLSFVHALQVGPLVVRCYTRWVSANGVEVPRELVVEARGIANSLDDAVTKFGSIGRMVATVIGFVANVQVGPLEVHLAYQSDADAVERPFVEVFLPDESGGVTEGRLIKDDLLSAVVPLLLTMTQADGDRTNRALRQYELALREWRIGGEWLALSHLWIAIETLTPVVLTRRLSAEQRTEEELATELGIAVNGPQRPRWKGLLLARVRLNDIFRGDATTHRAAKHASDGLEHGYLGLDEVSRYAIGCAEKTFGYLRQSLLELIQVAEPDKVALLAIRPRDVQSRRKVIRGMLNGRANDPAAVGELYPRLEWSSSVTAMTREGDVFRFDGKERITVRTHPDIRFTPESIEVIGRLEDGAHPVRLAIEAEAFQPAADAATSRLLKQAMVIIDSITAVGIAHPDEATWLAFNYFGQGVAYFQAVQSLLVAAQPVEALAVLRPLIVIAARFEQVGSGEGIALMVRLALHDQRAAGGDISAEPLVTIARERGIDIEPDLPDVEATAVHRSLSGEAQLADLVSNARYPAVGLHLEQSEGHVGRFRTRLEVGPLWNLVGSAAAIALVQLLQHAAPIFGWTLPTDELAALLSHARQINREAALARADGQQQPDI